MTASKITRKPSPPMKIAASQESVGRVAAIAAKGSTISVIQRMRRVRGTSMGKVRNPNIEIRNKSEGSERREKESFAALTFSENCAEDVHQLLSLHAESFLMGSRFRSIFGVDKP